MGLEAAISSDGHMFYFFSSGMASYTSSVVIGNLKVFLFSYIYSPLSVVLLFASIGFHYMTHYVFGTWHSSPSTFDVYGTFYHHYGNINYWV